VQAGVPDAAEPDPAALVAVPGDAVLVAADAALVADVLAPEVPVPVPAVAVVDVDEAAHPAMSTPVASSGMASSAFFTRSPNAERTGDASISVVTALYDAAAPSPVGERFLPRIADFYGEYAQQDS
jgi:hypothetical protein